MESKELVLEKIDTDENGVDKMIKSLSKQKFKFCKKEAFIVELPLRVEGGELFVQLTSIGRRKNRNT